MKSREKVDLRINLQLDLLNGIVLLFAARCRSSLSPCRRVSTRIIFLLRQSGWKTKLRSLYLGREAKVMASSHRRSRACTKWVLQCCLLWHRSVLLRSYSVSFWATICVFCVYSLCVRCVSYVYCMCIQFVFCTYYVCVMYVTCMNKVILQG